MWELTVFMDVYLSAGPSGSSHFPLEICWQAYKKKKKKTPCDLGIRLSLMMEKPFRKN